MGRKRSQFSTRCSAARLQNDRTTLIATKMVAASTHLDAATSICGAARLAESRSRTVGAFRGKNMLRKIESTVVGLCMFLACCAIVGMTLLILVEVIARTAFGISTQLEDEFGGYSLVCVAFMPLAWTYRGGVHIRITGLVEYLPTTLQKCAKILERSCLLIVALLLFWQGIGQVRNSYNFGAEAPTVTGTPLWIVQLLVPAGLFVLLPPVFIDLIKSVSSLFSSTPPPDSAAEGLSDPV
jgi:TRAP-type C4-dicarboxylate transport system permease small subunit